MKAVRDADTRLLRDLVWCFEDEHTPATAAVLDQVVERGAVVPAIWRLEVANGLQSALRRGRIDAAYLELALRRQLPLASLDRGLRTAAHALGVLTVRTVSTTAAPLPN